MFEPLLRAEHLMEKRTVLAISERVTLLDHPGVEVDPSL
jgi:hypothetical protein